MAYLSGPSCSPYLHGSSLYHRDFCPRLFFMHFIVVHHGSFSTVSPRFAASCLELERAHDVELHCLRELRLKTSFNIKHVWFYFDVKTGKRLRNSRDFILTFVNFSLKPFDVRPPSCACVSSAAVLQQHVHVRALTHIYMRTWDVWMTCSHTETGHSVT